MSKNFTLVNNRRIAVLLAGLTAILLIFTAQDVGLTWDEPAYIAAAGSYGGWFDLLLKSPSRAFKSETIDLYWNKNHEHPPLDKEWSCLIWSLSRHVFDDLTARRLGNILLAAFLIGMLYLLVAEAYGRAAGFFASISLLTMPRFFFHSHLAALDVPVAAAIFAVIFLFWRTMRTVDGKGWKSWTILGVAFGLAEAIKLNSTFIPIACIAWCLLFRRKRSLLPMLFIVGAVGALVFFAVWPWLYCHPLTRVMHYAGYHVLHFKIGQWYLGRFYRIPPWHFVFVMTWAVVPLSVMLMAFIGMARAGNGGKDKGLAWLLILSALVFIAPFAAGKILIYDNERLFMPLFPFLSALAGVGFRWTVDTLSKTGGRIIKRRIHPAAVGALLMTMLLLPQTMAMVGLYPHLLSYYSEGVGGVPGAAKLGLETTYWCETYSKAIPYINAHARPGDLVWLERNSFDVATYYQIVGKLRPDVKVLNDIPMTSDFGSLAPQPFVGPYQIANWYIFNYHQSQYRGLPEQYPVLSFLKTLTPVYQVAYRGIPLMQVYKR